MKVKEIKAAYARIPSGDSGQSEPPLPDSSEVVPFGKHKGKNIQVESVNIPVRR